MLLQGHSVMVVASIPASLRYDGAQVAGIVRLFATQPQGCPTSAP